MKSLNEDLKTGQFKQIYLLYGEEAYLKKQYRDRLTKALLPEGDTMNFAHFEGKGVDVKSVIDLSETLPFFAERRLIVFDNTGFFKSAGADLADYIKEMPDTTYYIFVEDEVENKQVTEQTIIYFLNKVGTDMENITKELEKLFSYTMEKTDITKEDVDAICVTQIANHIFDMVNAVAEKQQKKALDLYYELLALKEPPMRILFLMTRQYRMLFQVKHLANKGYSKKEIAAKTGLHPFAVGKYMDQAKYFKASELRMVMEYSADIEQRVKTGLLTDNLAVELFIIKYSSK